MFRHQRFLEFFANFHFSCFHSFSQILPRPAIKDRSNRTTSTLPRLLLISLPTPPLSKIINLLLQTPPLLLHPPTTTLLLLQPTLLLLQMTRLRLQPTRLPLLTTHNDRTPSNRLKPRRNSVDNLMTSTASTSMIWTLTMTTLSIPI